MISGIVLAAGFSTRMKQEKLLLPFKNMPVIERVVRAAKQSFLDELILVFQNERVREIAGRYKIKTVLNADAAQGQSTSIQAGILAAHPQTGAFMFLVGDQPYLDPQTINRLITVWKNNTGSIIVPLYKGSRGNPVIFPAQLKKDLLDLRGDTGGRTILDRMAENVISIAVDSDFIGADIDTPEAYDKLL